MKPGTLLATKYRLERVLGSGAMGEVWAATNESTGRPVAVKLLQSSTAELRTRMLREARAGGTLKHKNIVDIYDVGETDDGDPFLVMEQLTGETLDERLDRVGCLAPTTAVEIATAIAAALRVAHANGIIHRDLKPSNVFLHREAEGHDEVVKVLDFGVSKHLRETSGTLTAGLVGSPPYMSPEQACAEPNIDARSDLWSLGVVLFQMLSGRRPFSSHSPYMVITEVVSGPIPSIAEAVPGLSPGLVHVVERCLTRPVDARVASAEELMCLLGRSFDADASLAITRRLPWVVEEPTPKLEAMPPSSEAAPPAADATAPPVPVGEAPVALAVGDHSGITSVPRRGPSNAVVALVACVAALLLIMVFGLTLRRAPAASSAVASTELAEPLQGLAIPTAAAPSSPPPLLPPSPPPEATPPPAVATAQATATSEPAALPRLGKDEALIVVDAPPDTSVSLDGKPIGTVPVAPLVVPPGLHKVSFKHPTLGERVVTVAAQAGEASLAATEFGNAGSGHLPAHPRTHPSGEVRLRW